MTEIVPFESIRDCLRSGIPGSLAACTADGIPHISYVSRVRYLDHERVAMSRQLFNRVPPSTFSQALIACPTGAQFQLDLHHLHTATEGDDFDEIRANLDAIASQTGMGPAFRLRGLDVHRVLRCTAVSSPSRDRSAPPDLLGSLEQFSRRLERTITYEQTTHEVLAMLEDLFGIRYAVLLALDAPTGRLFATAGSGDARGAVGAEVEFGAGMIGTAAARRRLVVTANLDRSRALADAIEGGDRARRGLEIPLPALAGARSAAAVPLIVGDDVLGVLYLESEAPSFFNGPIEGALRIVGAQTAAALAARGAPAGEEPHHRRSTRPHRAADRRSSSCTTRPTTRCSATRATS